MADFSLDDNRPSPLGIAIGIIALLMLAVTFSEDVPAQDGMEENAEAVTQ